MTGIEFVTEKEIATVKEIVIANVDAVVPENEIENVTEVIGIEREKGETESATEGIGK